MAKYSLNRANKIQCSILDENCLSNTYTVRFNNGVVRNVPKSRISNLDRIDEGVLSKLKEVGQRLIDNIVKVGHNLFAKFRGGLGQTLMNIMFRAEEKDGVSFIPAPSFVDMCDSVGVEATTTEDFDYEDEQFLDEIDAYWMEKCGLNTANESYSLSSYSSRVASRVNRARRLYEEAIEVKLPAAEGGFDNIDATEIKEMLEDQYAEFLYDGAGIPGGNTPIPYCIWGAPGIGKTQIVQGIIKSLQAEGFDANMILINAMTMRKDDFTLPGVKHRTRRIIGANGQDVDFKYEEAAELAKSWLPMYNPDDANDEVTEEQLDDLVNGGDGSGNGKGGILFIDELSRVSLDVMDVLMQFVQSRTLGKHKLGSKWMIVAAANRVSDMGERGELVQWEPAWTGRWSHVNFVPTFEDWCEWAESTGPNGKPKVRPIIVQFLREHQNFWYSSVSSNSVDDVVSDTMYPTGRGYANVSKEIESREGAMKAMADTDDTNGKGAFLRMARKNRKGNIPNRTELNPYEMGKIMKHHVGSKVANAFVSWAAFDARYTDDMAKQVWTKGDQAPMDFAISPATVEKALIKILGNHPDYTGSKAKTLNLTPNQLMNVMKFLVACADEMDGGTGNTRNQVLNAGYATLCTKLLMAPYKIDLSNSAKDQDKYDDAIQYIMSEIAKTGDIIQDNI